MRKCDECGATVTIERNAVRRYDIGGLPHIVLHGVEVARCADCGVEEVSIPRIAELHRVLAAHFIGQTRPLAPNEIQFLRKHIGLSTNDFAKCMGVTRETVSRWVNGSKPMSPQADRLLRLLVATSMPTTDYAAKDALQEIDSSKRASKKPAKFGVRISPDGWRPERELIAS